MTALSFGQFVARARSAGQLVVQARMGMSDPDQMRAGLRAVREAGALTVGTITLDSYTRLGEHDKARAALAAGTSLNGYPIVVHDTIGPERELGFQLGGLVGGNFLKDYVVSFDLVRGLLRLRHAQRMR